MDITFCMNKKCRRRYKCLRYTYKTHGDWCSMSSFKCKKSDKNNDYFIDSKEGKCYNEKQMKKLETYRKALDFINGRK